MSDIANTLYGADDAPSTTAVPNPAQADTAATARQLYDRPAAAPEQRGTGHADVLFDAPGAVDQAAQSLASEAADQGRILPDQVEPMAMQLTAELDTLGINERSERDALMRDLRRAAPTGKDAQLAQGATLKELHSRYGADYANVLDATNKWLRKTAPVIASAMSHSMVGNDVRYVVPLVEAYQRSRRS